MIGSRQHDSSFIVGLAHEYPPYLIKQEGFEELVDRLCPEHIASPGIQKLLHFNRRTGILSRPTILDYTTWTKDDATPPSINSLALTFRTVGVDLTTLACRKALQEARLAASDITHVVAVTCTDQSNPGYDLFVCQKLGLGADVQRVLLHGVGCAGGLAALRTAADITAAASQRGRRAHVLVMACELCSLYFRAELQAACQDGDALHIAPALFSDAAAALVVCNGLALGEDQKPIFELTEWGSMVVPRTTDLMSYDIDKNGMIATITKDVPKAAISAITPLFDHLCRRSRTSHESKSLAHRRASDFDWALHPGGAAILQRAKHALQLADDHVRASTEVYREFGNSSSATVLIVLDRLRHSGRGRDDVVATSFGPGLTIEMVLMMRCRHADASATLHLASTQATMYKLWVSLHSKFSRIALGDRDNTFGNTTKTSQMRVQVT